MKDIVARALILNTTSLYGVNFESVSGKFQKSQKHKLDILDYSQQKWYCLQYRWNLAIMPTQQTILEMEFADSESDSDDEEEEEKA